MCIGDLLSEDEVLEWLRKNRFRQPELNIFMYALIALAVAFVVYTAFLLQCFKPAPPPPVQHPKQSWWDPASIHMHECRLASFLLLLLWNWKLLKNINDIIYTTTKACLRVERDREGGRREQMKKFNKNYTTHAHTHHTLQTQLHTHRQTDRHVSS